MIQFINRRWFLILSLLLGIYVGLPFLAPVFMHIGWNGPGKAIYFIYSWLCHQFPQRSYFLFGDKFTYSLREVQRSWPFSANPLVLRQFIGNAVMGWKIAWSDRMVSMFTSLWLFGLIWWLVRKRLKPLPWWGLILFLLPLAVDGLSHTFSDLAGIGNGFRDSNTWLASLTHQAFPTGFYAGDGWGSFNSIMRLLTGILFGLGVVWFSYPYLNEAFYPHKSWRLYK